MPPKGSSRQQNSTAAPGAAATPPKRKRNQPGHPNPDSVVIALSPETLMTTNRFVCEVCHKGFQRDQNLQLHLRGHNMPWKLKQKNPRDNRRRVYVCPEVTCVHHDPSRALGDLTGIKKHYCRKHGEKNLRCDRCNKRYAVESDWKAHTKTCGTREYRCECNVVFSRSVVVPPVQSVPNRRDSFVNHRSVCDVAINHGAQVPAPGAGLYIDSGSSSLGETGLNVDSGSNSLELSEAEAHMHDFAADQGQSSSAVAASQFDHIMPSSTSPGSSILRYHQASASSSSFLVGGGASPTAQDFYGDGGDHYEGIQQGHLLHGKAPLYPSMMQLPEQQHQPGIASSSSFFPGGGASPTALNFYEAGGDHSEGSQGPLLHGKAPLFPNLMQLPQHHQHLDQGRASSSSFFPGGGASPTTQVFYEDGVDHSQGSWQGSLLHGKAPLIPQFHGVMQLPEQQQYQPGSSNVNVNHLKHGFFSGNTGGSSSSQGTRFVIQDQFNGGGGGGGSNYVEHCNMMAPIGGHHSGGLPLLYNSYPSAGLPQNSATALLIKAAQMGSTSSSTTTSTLTLNDGPNALLRAVGFGTAASGNQGTISSRAAGEGSKSHAAHFHELLVNSDSLTGGIHAFSDDTAAFGVGDGMLSTRDFLGVGGGTMAPPGLHIGGLDPSQLK